MEDLTTTAGAYSKDELAIMVRHPVTSEVLRILTLQEKIKEFATNRDMSINTIKEQSKSCFNDMTDIWSLLGPATVIARRLFPEHSNLFDSLEKSFSLRESFGLLASGKSIGQETSCDRLCCRKQLA